MFKEKINVTVYKYLNKFIKKLNKANMLNQ